MCVCVFRCIHAYSVCVQGKTAGFSSTVRGAWLVMTTESSLPAWWVYFPWTNNMTSSMLDKKLNQTITNPSLPFICFRFTSWWAPATRPRSSCFPWLKTSWVPACSWLCVETRPWWRCVSTLCPCKILAVVTLILKGCCYNSVKREDEVIHRHCSTQMNRLFKVNSVDSLRVC